MVNEIERKEFWVTKEPKKTTLKKEITVKNFFKGLLYKYYIKIKNKR